MLIAQITDVHLGFDVDVIDEDNAMRLDMVVRAIAALDVRPDLLLATGDLADKGEAEAYERVKAALAPLGIPVLAGVGNHDRRAAFGAAFPHSIADDGFAQFAYSTASLRILMLDTLGDGRHGGAFCRTRATWLAERLDEQPEMPTIIVLHHPPIDTGIDWLTTAPAEPWVARLAEVVRGRTAVVAMLAGHVHRPIASRFAGIPLAVCPSVAPAVALELATIDPEVPDGRPMVVAASPGFALHWWNGTDLVSHFRTAEAPEVLLRFAASTQPMVRRLFDERPSVR